MNNPSHFVAPDGRFDHVLIDLIGPLPVSEGFMYCLTMIDRFSRWEKQFLQGTFQLKLFLALSLIHEYPGSIGRP